MIERPPAGTRQAPSASLADTSPRGPRTTEDPASVWAWPLLAAAICVALVAYGSVFDGDARALGWDPFAYIWQAKAMDLGAADVTARPGAPTLIAWLGTLLGLEIDDAVAILVMLLPLLVGLGAGVAVGIGLRAPALAVPVVVIVAAVWPANGRSIIGYFAFLLSTAVLVAASALLVRDRGRAMAFLLLVAGFLAHPLSFVLFAGIVGCWVLLSTLVGPGSAVARIRASLGVLAIVVLAGLAGAVAVFVLGGVAVGDLTAIDVEQFFRRRTVDAINQHEPFVTVPLVAIGAAATLMAGRSREAAATGRLWASWLVVTLGATGAALAGVPVPGGRFLYFAVPLAILAGLGIVTAGMAVARRPGIVRRSLAGLVTAALVAAIVPLGLRIIERRQAPGDPEVREVARRVGTYLDQVPGSRPVVVVAERAGVWGAYTPKYRLNALRSAVPDRYVLQTYVYVGEVENLLVGRPTLRTAADGPSYRIYNDVSRRMWEDVEPALDRDPVLLVIERYARREFRRIAAADPGGVVARGIYVVRGPRVGPPPAPPDPPLQPLSLFAGTVAALLLLGALGWGWCATIARRLGARIIDVAVLAPVAGAAVVVVVGYAMAILGVTPHPVLRWVAVAVFAGGGLLVWILTGRGDRPARESSRD